MKSEDVKEQIVRYAITTCCKIAQSANNNICSLLSVLCSLLFVICSPVCSFS